MSELDKKTAANGRINNKPGSEGAGGRQRRHFTGEQKIAILKRHLVDKTKVSDLCDEHNIQPTQFYAWQKQLFENGAAAFERKTKKPSPEKRQLEQLQAKIQNKNEVIAELMEENIKAKKANGDL